MSRTRRKVLDKKMLKDICELLIKYVPRSTVSQFSKEDRATYDSAIKALHELTGKEEDAKAKYRDLAECVVATLNAACSRIRDGQSDTNRSVFGVRVMCDVSFLNIESPSDIMNVASSQITVAEANRCYALIVEHREASKHLCALLAKMAYSVKKGDLFSVEEYVTSMNEAVRVFVRNFPEHTVPAVVCEEVCRDTIGSMLHTSNEWRPYLA